MTKNKWAVINPNAKSENERTKAILFNDFESAENWTMEGTRFEKGFIIRHLPCTDASGKWEIDRTNYIVKDVFKRIEEKAKKRNKKVA